jgi:hypothetical protein
MVGVYGAASGAGAAGAGGGAGAAVAAGACPGRKGVTGGISRPPERSASSDSAATSRSGASRADAISRRPFCARSAEGPMAPLAIERMVTTRPGGMFGGAGAPDGSTPNAAQTAIPQERTSARKSLCEGAPRTAAAGCPAILTSPFDVTRTADALKPPIAMPVSCSAATPERTAAPNAAAAGGVRGPRVRIVPSGVPSFGSTATQTPVLSVPHPRTGESAGCGWSKRRCRRGTAAAASAGGTGISWTTTCLPFLRTAFQPWPAPGPTSSINLGFGSVSGI